MTSHPAWGLTQGVVHTFDRIALGYAPENRNLVGKHLDTLLKQGLVEYLPAKKHTLGGVAVFTYPKYQVPPLIWERWLEWVTQRRPV